jgi:3-isopropylmalate/(R)-2-methylmalate dehydratase large subunit
MNSTGKTFVEKALARAAGVPGVVAGQIVDARPDWALSHDNSAAILRIFRQLGVARVWDAARIAITLDHAAPAPTTKHAENHAEVRRFVAEQDIPHFFEVGRGVCHQVVSEEALVLPGQIILGADSHTPHFGWLGAFGAGVGRSEMAAIWATGELWLRVPESIQIRIEGRLSDWTTAKDLALHIIGQLGADGGLYASVELSGPAIDCMSLESRMVLPNMMAECGVKNAYLPPDDPVFDWLTARRCRRMGTVDAGVEVATRQAVQANALFPDPDASYQARFTFDAGRVEPLVACPHTVDHVAPVSAVSHVHVDQAFIGTCTNGRLEDLAEAARVVAGQRVARGTRLLIVPASSQVYREALRAGYVETLLDAGAVIGPPGCGPCMGNHMGILAPGEVCISSANRNFRGRMGTADSEIYLASPAVVAASAIAGRIVHPALIAG